MSTSWWVEVGGGLESRSEGGRMNGCLMMRERSCSPGNMLIYRNSYMLIQFSKLNYRWRKACRDFISLTHSSILSISIQKRLTSGRTITQCWSSSLAVRPSTFVPYWRLSSNKLQQVKTRRYLIIPIYFMVKCNEAWPVRKEPQFLQLTMRSVP